MYGFNMLQGYFSNIKSLLLMEELKLISLKSYNCHALIQKLLLVTIQSVLLKHMRHAITRLYFFFNVICAKVIDLKTMDDFQNKVMVMLCQLKMYFLPSFFDIIVHLVVHLVRET